MNNKIKILWFCNVAFSDTKPNSSGTWLHSMADALIKTGKIKLYNITQAKIKSYTRQDYDSINQWLLPTDSLRRDGLPSVKTIKYIQKIVDDVKPDVIHIWGTENYWGLLTARGYIKGNTILEIQGLKFAIEKYFYSGLTLKNLIKCIRIKEIIKPSSSLFIQKYKFKSWGKFEKEMLQKHINISTQSDWVRAYVKNLNPNANIYRSYISIRQEFLESNKWDKSNCIPYQIFTSTSSIIPYKGLHILIYAISILKKQYPKTKLFIAGPISKGIRESGYSIFIKKLSKKLGIEDSVIWLGSLNGKEIIKEMHKANVVVVPSFIESYCLALDESLTLGVPTVVSYSGAMPEFSLNKGNVFYFPPNDEVMCANHIEKIFNKIEFEKENSNDLVKRISLQNNACTNQLHIYTKLIQSNQ